jgi:hypothetical protein
MKGFQDNSFQNAFQRIMSGAKALPTAVRWTIAGVEWHRDRHTHTGQEYSYTVEVHRLFASGPKSWALLYVIETWWYGSETSETRRASWGKVMKGKRSDVFAWFRAQEKAVL